MGSQSLEANKSVAECDTSVPVKARPDHVEDMSSANSSGTAISERILTQCHSSDTSTSTCRSPLTDGGDIINERGARELTPLTELSSLTSDSCEDASAARASVTSDGSGSSDATSSEIPAQRKSPKRPRLFMDCVIPPPFYIPKQLFRPMREVHPEMVSNAGDESNATSPQPETAPSRRRRGKRRKRDRSRSRSPLHVYSEEQALDMFGQNLTMYSVCGPPGGYLIGTGNLQCCPEDNGRASYSVDIDDERLQRLVEGTRQARDELLASSSAATPTLKPPKAKALIIKPKVEPVNKSKTSRARPTEASSCHFCCQKSTKPKMTCSSLSPNGTRCKARFCESCIRRKFPDVKFDSEDTDFTCPRCAGYCPCAACTRRKKKDETKDGPESQMREKSTPAEASSREKGISRSSKANTPLTSLNRLVDGASGGKDASVEESILVVGVALQGSDADSSRAETTKVTSMKAQDSQWVNLALDDSPETEGRSCHQCRKRNSFSKMHCNNVLETGATCDTHYCHKCISSRYPDFIFTSNAAFTCFKCENTCNCGTCARNRGEEYIKTSNIKTGKPNVAQVNLPMAQSRSGRTIKPSEKARHAEADNDAEHSHSGPRKRRRRGTLTSAADDASAASIAPSRTMKKSATGAEPQVILGSPLSESRAFDR